MKVRVKICGMRETLNISEVATLQPDYMGFIFYPKSPRYVGEDFDLPDNFPSAIKRVGVFVNENTAAILKHAKRLTLDYLQLHGDETVEQSEQLKNAGFKIIKAFSVDENFDFDLTLRYKNAADYFLFDTKGKLYGGNAKAFDWNILKRYNQEVPFFLSGGLNMDNIGDVHILHDMNLHAVDLNSGVEIRPALKDIEKIRLMNDIIHSAS